MFDSLADADLTDARTTNVRDTTWPTLDTVIAAAAGRWPRLTVPKLRDRIDALIARHDPDAVRVPPKEHDNRYVDIRPTTPGKDAIGALGRRHNVLDCQCALPDCPVRAEQHKATDIVIHLLAEQSTLDGTSNHPGYLVDATLFPLLGQSTGNSTSPGPGPPTPGP